MLLFCLFLSEIEGRTEMWGRPPVWYDMKPNLALNKYGDHIFPGSLLVGLNAGPMTDQIDDLLPKMKAKQISNVKHRANVIIQIFEAQRLPQLDPNGYSDPYVKAIIGQETSSKRVSGDDHMRYQERRTETLRKTLNPKWNGEVLEFQEVYLGDYLKIQVWDWDLVGDDEFSSYINAIPLNGKDIEEWIPLITTKTALEKHPRNKKLAEGSQIKIAVRYEFLDPEQQRKRKQRRKTSIFDPLGLFSKKYTTEDISKLQRPPKIPMHLNVYVYQAKNLPNRDNVGLTDAYLVVRFCGEEERTRVIDNHIDPQWFEILTLNVMVPWDDVNELNNAPRIYCELYDYDYLQKDETLGRFTISPSTIYGKYASSRNKNNKSRTPTWFQLEDSNHQQVEGEVLVYFELTRDRSIDGIPRSIKPKTHMQWMHIITLGLREIESLFGVHKPFIEFEVNGITYETVHSNIPSARNPNFNQILHFKVSLPVDPLYMPSLNITIKDAIAGGVFKRQIGFASIDLAEHMAKVKAEKEDKGQSLLDLSSDDDGKDDEKKFMEEHREDIGLLSGDEVNEDNRPWWNPFKRSKKKKRKRKRKDVTVEHDGKMQKEKTYEDNGGDAKNKSKYKLGQEHHEWAKYDVTKDYELDRYSAPYMKNRDVVKSELEDKMSLSPFHDIRFFNGRNKKRHVGYFKGLISVTDTKKDLFDNKYLTDVMKPTELYLRLYVLNGINIMPADSETLGWLQGKGDIGLSDPYLIIKFGNKKISTRDRYIADTKEPEFYEAFEFGMTLPGPSKLNIEVWDYDGIGDDLVGKTSIDIEDRWYCKQWREIKETKDNVMPLELRSLHIDASSQSQGTLELWVEILTVDERKKYPIINVKPPKQDEYELRVIIWECKNVAYHDEQTNANDLYITGRLQCTTEDDEPNEQQTDLHFRSHDGFGSFNWRMKFPIKLPKKKFLHYPRFRLQIWDKDYFTPNDCISECIIPLARFLRFCEINGKDTRCKMVRPRNDIMDKSFGLKKDRQDEDEEDQKIWVNLDKKVVDNIEKDPLNLNANDVIIEFGKEKIGATFDFVKDMMGLGGKMGKGQVLISMELLSSKYVKLLPAGLGRDMPNKNPFLPEPTGRHKFSIFHPCDALRRIFGDKLCIKLGCLCCWLVCMSFLFLITPNMVSAITANIIV